MKDWFKGTWWIIPISLLVVAVIFLMVLSNTSDYTVVLINPTEEQVLELYKQTSEETGFWVKEVHAVKGERSLLEVTIGVRALEGERRVREELEELRLDYYLVGRTRR